MRSAQNKTWNHDDGAHLPLQNKVLVFTKHYTPGRARFFVRGLFDSDFLKSCLEHELAAKGDIFFCAASTKTGNLLVRFREDIPAQTLRGHIEEIVRNIIVVVLHDPLAKTDIKRETIHPHMLSVDDTSHMLATSAKNGLTEKEAARRLRLRGPNIVQRLAPVSSLSLFFEQFNNLPAALLAGSTVLSIMSGGLLDAALVGVVLIVNGTIAFQTQRHARQIIESIDRPIDEKVLVVRDGQTHAIHATELVEGDIVALRTGIVPADMRLMQARRLTVDESSLTGESVPVFKNADVVLSENSVLSDRENMIYRGTTITGGDGLGIVTATGSNTELGHIQNLVSRSTAPDTPLQKDLQRIGDQAVTLTGLLCGSVFIVGLLRGISLREMVQTVISLSVAAIPEGLPTIGTTALAHGVKKLGKSNVLIKNLGGVETLGAIDVICLDKTGTLTSNNMTLEELYVGRKTFHLKDGMLDDWSNRRVSYPELEQLFSLTVLCSEATATRKDDSFDIKGSGTETAFLKAALRHGINLEQVVRDFERYKAEWRTEEQPYMKTFHTRTKGKKKLLAVKGSPLAVLKHCSRYLSEGEIQPITHSFRKAVERENETMAAKGLRVLGVAFKDFESDTSLHDWVWVGLAGLLDPLRPGLEPLIDALKSFGIHICVLTGDQATTALAIGRSLKLNGSDSMQVLDAEEIGQMSDEELQTKIKDTHIFSRVNPSQKLRIVNAFQKLGKVVAMTGDGINDGPALKVADVGITMGHEGAHTAREIADIVVSNDQLDSLIQAISHGRALRNNLHNSVRFILSTNISESFVMLGALLIGSRNPFNPMQLLWINLVTDIFPALALALESPADGNSHNGHHVGESIISDKDRREILRESIVLTAGTLIAYKMPGGAEAEDDMEQASTVAEMAMVAGQMLHSWHSRHRRNIPRPAENGMLLGATIGGLSAQILTVVWPTMRDLLAHRSLRRPDLFPVLVGSVAPYVINRYLDSRESRHHVKSPQKEGTADV